MGEYQLAQRHHHPFTIIETQQNLTTLSYKCFCCKNITNILMEYPVEQQRPSKGNPAFVFRRDRSQRFYSVSEEFQPFMKPVVPPKKTGKTCRGLTNFRHFTFLDHAAPG